MASPRFYNFALTTQYQTDRLTTRMASPSTATTPWLPHLNGLRALAILGVLLYHLRADYCPAGYFGVDVFFVLSGFLLFRSLLHEGAAERFHYGHFLLKKAWRILPAWFAVTAVTCLTASLLMHPAQLGTTMLTAASSAGFFANCFVDHSGDYFNPLSQQNPLLHFWYLSLTQQFYLIAPLLVIPLARLVSRRAALALLGLLALLSLVFYVLTSTPGPIGEALLRGTGARSAYYHFIPRFHELAAGAFVFLLPEFSACPRLRAVLGALGLVGLLASFYLYGTGSPSIYLTLASSLLALRYADSGPAARVLTCRPMQALGTISFSLYLWHWPLMVFWKYCRFDNPTPWDELGMLALSLLLGALSWRFVESLRLPKGTGWRGCCLRASLLLCLPLVALTALHLHARAREFSGRGLLGQAVLIQHPVVERDAAVLRGLEGLPALHLAGKPLLLGTDKVPPSFLLIGDSHAQHLYDALHAACLETGIRGVYLNNTVSPYHGLIQPQVGADTCRWNPEIEKLLLSYLDAHPTISRVLIAQCWQMRMGEGYGLDGRTGRELNGREARLAVTTPGIGLFCDLIRERGREAVLLGETPRFPRPCPLEEWHRRELLGVPQRERCMTCAEFEERHTTPLATLRQLAQEGRARLLELTPALRVGDAYPARHEGEFWYYDANHLTPVAARRVVQLILPLLTSPR